MTHQYLIEQYREGRSAKDRAPLEFATLDDAREGAAEWLGVGTLCDEMRGGCPDEDQDGLIGIECWMPYPDDDYIPDGTVFIYRRTPAREG